MTIIGTEEMSRAIRAIRDGARDRLKTVKKRYSVRPHEFPPCPEHPFGGKNTVDGRKNAISDLIVAGVVSLSLLFAALAINENAKVEDFTEPTVEESVIHEPL